MGKGPSSLCDDYGVQSVIVYGIRVEEGIECQEVELEELKGGGVVGRCIQ